MIVMDSRDYESLKDRGVILLRLTNGNPEPFLRVLGVDYPIQVNDALPSIMTRWRREREDRLERASARGTAAAQDCNLSEHDAFCYTHKSFNCGTREAVQIAATALDRVSSAAVPEK